MPDDGRLGEPERLDDSFNSSQVCMQGVRRGKRRCPVPEEVYDDYPMVWRQEFDHGIPHGEVQPGAVQEHYRRATATVVTNGYRRTAPRRDEDVPVGECRDLIVV